MSFSWLDEALMFISPGISAPALSHRFHTFLLANLTVLLPAAESEPGVGRISETALLTGYSAAAAAAALGPEPGGSRGGRRSPVS